MNCYSYKVSLTKRGALETSKTVDAEIEYALMTSKEISDIQKNNYF